MQLHLELSGIEGARGRTVSHTVQIPTEPTASHIAMMVRDAEAIKSVGESKSDGVRQIVSCMGSGDSETAKMLAREIGLTEDALQSSGGNWIGLAIAIGVLLYSQEAF